MADFADVLAWAALFVVFALFMLCVYRVTRGDDE